MVLNIIIIISISLKIFFDIKYHRLLNKGINKNVKDINSYKIGVSIIICCKNEIQNLQENLKFIVNQNYDYFEIVIVDDGSIDKTDNYIKENFPSVRIIKTYDYENKYPGKKNALSLGINAAKNEIILLTDADCKPISKEWIKEMVKPFEKKEIEIVLGLRCSDTFSAK